MTAPYPEPSVEEIRRAFHLLHQPGAIVELRVPKTVRAGTVSGYYNNVDRQVADTKTLNNKHGSVSATLNEVNPALLSRRANHFTERADQTTSDGDIVRRRHLLFDIDPCRPSGISSTDAEHEAAIATARAISAWLTEMGWPEPALCDSGNGAHLVYRIDLANDEAARTLIRDCLDAVAARFNSPAISVDTSVGNAGRLCKVPGTVAKKGDHTADRPHRLARILEAPAELRTVVEPQLQALAVLRPTDPHSDIGSARGSNRRRSSSFDLVAWLAANSIEVNSSSPWKGGTLHRLASCPIKTEHTNGSAYAIQLQNGALSADCLHQSCQGWRWAELRAKFEPDRSPNRRRDSGPAGDSNDDERVASHTAQLVNLVTQSAELFHTPDRAGFASVRVGTHRETYGLRQKTFKELMLHLFYRSEQGVDDFDDGGQVITVPGQQAIASALQAIEARATFAGPEMPVFVRVGEHAGNIYLDLGDADWRAVCITSDGWDVIDNPPVRFRRARGMLALPVPERGGVIDELRPFLNVGTETHFRLVITWLVAALFPTGPYPLLSLPSEQGSGKSTMARVLRSLIDPNQAAIRAEPRDVRDLMIAAQNGWCVALDNLSSLSPWLSDALCRMATGGGFATRELYTDTDEVIFDAMRPVIMTGIDDYLTRPDLIDRTLNIGLAPIPESHRRPERTFWQEFHVAQPRILGALMDAAVMALRDRGTVRLDRHPRMADFAELAVSAAPALGWTAEQFLDAYAGNRDDANSLALEASPVGGLLVTLGRQPGGWSGTASALLAELGTRTRAETQIRGWPGSPKAISSILARLTPNLRAAGVEVGRRREGHASERIISLTGIVDEPASAPSASSEDTLVPYVGVVPSRRTALANGPKSSAEGINASAISVYDEGAADGADDADGVGGSSQHKCCSTCGSSTGDDPDCWNCGARLCQDCGQPTGSPTSSQCFPCALSTDEGATS